MKIRMRLMQSMAAVFSALGLAVQAFGQGQVVGWGANEVQQVGLRVHSVVRWSELAAGGQHTVALKADGTVVAWGDNAFNQCAVPSDLAGVMQVAAGENHSVALKIDGTVVAWGWNANTIVPLRLTIAQVMCEQGRVEEAWKFSLETEKLCERARTPMLIEALKSSASVAEELKWLEEAESRLRRVCSYYKFEVDDKRMTASDMEPIDAATNHGRVLMLMKRHREANEVLRPALDAARRRRPDSGALWAVAQQWFENLQSWPATEPGRPNLEQEVKLFNEVKEAREQALKQS